MSKYEIKAQKRIESIIGRYTDIVRRAEQAGFNEADTSAIAKDMLGEVFGYDKFFDVTSEYKIKGHYVDYGVKIDNELRFLVETKAIGIPLEEKHLFQLIAYSANQGLEWMVLTNARVWQCYHLALGKGSETKLVFQVDFLDDNQPLNEKIENLFLLTKEGMWCGALQKYLERLQALDPLMIVHTVLSEPVLTVLRREVKKATQYNLAVEDLKETLIHQVIRANIAFWDIGSMKHGL